MVKKMALINLICFDFTYNVNIQTEKLTFSQWKTLRVSYFHPMVVIEHKRNICISLFILIKPNKSILLKLFFRYMRNKPEREFHTKNIQMYT